MTCSKSHRAGLAGTGAVFLLMNEILFPLSTIHVYTEGYLVVQELQKATKEFILMSPPWSSTTGPQIRGLRKGVSGERGRQFRFKDGGAGAWQKMVQ